MLFFPHCAVKETVKLVFYVLVCQVQEDTLLVLWQPVGDGESFTQHSKGGFCLSRPKLPP